MRSIVSYLVVAAMALHTLLGCCFHHAHAHETTSCCAHSDVALGLHDDHGCDEQSCDEHQHASCDDHSDHASAAANHDGDDHDAPAPCSESCEGTCQFVSTSRVQLEKPVAVHDAWLATALPVVVVEESAYVSFETRRSTVPPLPIRLHLWNGLLLI